MRNRNDLTKEEIEALPYNHPWKNMDKFAFMGQEFCITKDEEVKAHEELERQVSFRVAKERLERHYIESSGVPQRYHGESLETFNAYTEELNEALSRVKEYASSHNNKILILCGGNGVGKTHLACGIIRECGGYYLSAQRLVFMAESAMSYRATESKIDLLDRLSECSMLVLDEVARGLQSERQQELVQYIIDARYSRLKPMVLVSNLGKTELIQWLGQSIKDRLNEVCIFMEIKGESYRKNKREA